MNSGQAMLLNVIEDDCDVSGLKNFLTPFGHIALKFAARLCSQYSNVDFFSSFNARRSTISTRSEVMPEDSFAVSHAFLDFTNH